MDIELKNGESIHLEIGPLFMEYLDDYDGGIEKLLADWKNKVNTMYISNHFAYAAIASNYDKPIDYRNTLKLIKLDDLIKIVEFVVDSLPTIQNHINNSKAKHF